MTEEDVANVLERLPALVNADVGLVRRGRFLSCDFLAGCLDHHIVLTIREGAIVDTARDQAPMQSWQFAIRASAQAWHRFWQPVPEPGYNDLLAMARFGNASIDGDLQPVMANLRYIKEVLEAPRRAGLEQFSLGDGDAG